MGLMEFSFCAAAEREIVSDANEKSSYINLRSTNCLRIIVILHDLGWLPLHRVSTWYGISFSWLCTIFGAECFRCCWKYCSGQSSPYEASGSMTFLLSVTTCNVDIRRAVRPCRVNSGTIMSPEILNA